MRKNVYSPLIMIAFCKIANAKYPNKYAVTLQKQCEI